jgi:hypothetical protein
MENGGPSVVFSFALLPLLVLTSTDEPTQPSSVYAVHPSVDGPVLVTTAVSWLVLATAGPSLVDPHCPCPSSEVPGIDRVALGKHNPPADVASTVTLGVALAAPVVVDW